MGAKGLRKLLTDNAPKSIKERKLANYFGRRIAIDANICIYQFLTAMRGSKTQILKNHNGVETSHISILFKRTVKFISAGIEPVFVFDGTPPHMKRQEIDKRNERREDAKKQLEQLDPTVAIEDGDRGVGVEELRKRVVQVSTKQYEDCKRLLRLMGVPVIEAPSEAEAQCSQLCKDCKVHAVASEDSDALTFGAPKVLMNFKASDGEIIKEYRCPKMLKNLGLDMDQFIDLCILCGCDYCDSIEGIKAQEALNLIRQHGSIENILVNKDSSYQWHDNWLYKEARQLFKQPVVNLHITEKQLQWTKEDEKGLIQFLVKENDFSEEIVEESKNKMNDGRKKPKYRCRKSGRKIQSKVRTRKPRPKKR